LRSDLQECACLTRLLPEIRAGLVEPPPNVATTPDHKRRLIFDAVRRFLTRIGGPTGVLLALDDLQWAGPDALDLIATLAHDAATIPLRIVASYRDTEAPPGAPLSVVIDDLARDRLSTQLRLNALAIEEAEVLLRTMLKEIDAEAPVIDPIVRQVLRKAEGAPFFLVSWASLWAPHVSASGNRRREAVALSSIPAEWDPSRGGNHRHCNVPDFH
jgi:predicted ATPase